MECTHAVHRLIVVVCIRATNAVVEVSQLVCYRVARIQFCSLGRPTVNDKFIAVVKILQSEVNWRRTNLCCFLTETNYVCWLKCTFIMCLCDAVYLFKVLVCVFVKLKSKMHLRGWWLSLSWWFLYSLIQHNLNSYNLMCVFGCFCWDHSSSTMRVHE